MNPRHKIKEKETTGKQYRYKDYFLATNDPRFIIIMENISPSKCGRILKCFENLNNSKILSRLNSNNSNDLDNFDNLDSNSVPNDDPRLDIILVPSIGISKNQIGMLW